MKITNIYMAGPLFDFNEQISNEAMANALNIMVNNNYPQSRIKVFNPQDEYKAFEHVGDDQELPRLSIKANDLKHIDNNTLMIVNLTGIVPDPGTVYEMAYAEARSIPVLVYKYGEQRSFIDGYMNAMLYPFSLYDQSQETIYNLDNKEYTINSFVSSVVKLFIDKLSDLDSLVDEQLGGNDEE